MFNGSQRFRVDAIGKAGETSFDLLPSSVRATDFQVTVIGHDGSVVDTVADIESIVNALNVIYERDLQITYRITEIIVRESRNDPYTSSDPNTPSRR